MPLPSTISKTNCDASTDDPKLALLVDLATAIDTINALIASVQPLDDELTTLSGISPAQAIDLAALSAFMGTVLNDASAAAALATLGAPLNAVAAKSAAYTVVAADRGKLIDYTSGSYTLGIDPAATLGAGFVFAYRNSGSGTITIDPNGSEQIDGATTLSVGPGESGFVVCTGTTWRTVGRSLSFDALSPTTTKGDLIVDNGTTPVRLPVGTNGQALVADSTQAAGVKWGSSGVPTDVGMAGIGVINLMYISSSIVAGATISGGSLQYPGNGATLSASGVTAAGTWRNIGVSVNNGWSNFQRIA